MDVCVLGAGTMGQGIAHASATAGHEVRLRDVEQEYVDEGVAAIRSTLDGGVEHDKLTPAEADAAFDRIEGYTDLAPAVEGADLVVEAVPEDVDLKQETFAEVETHASDDVVVATNTSSISVTEIASALDSPDRAIGLHFFNPVHVMDLVEVVVAEQTDDATVDFAHEFVASIEKTAVEVADTPGFASSRLGVALGCEAMRMVEEGVASVDDVDEAMELGYSHPVGPLELTDIVGLDVRLDILEYLREELGERFRPPQVLKRKVRAGKLGKKTGEGFYVWEDGEAVRPAGEVAE
ncbi:MAG: 3-hydroxyacyl-CoA dehydrogenase family protein [Halopenitus sp.]